MSRPSWTRGDVVKVGATATILAALFFLPLAPVAAIATAVVASQPPKTKGT